MVVVRSYPVEAFADAVATEAGSGGWSDVINAADIFSASATILSSCEYR